MGSIPTKDTKDGGIPTSTVDDVATDVAVGSMNEQRPYTLSTFYRSVLFQMVMFGA
jgi:hypothetical protein